MALTSADGATVGVEKPRTASVRARQHDAAAPAVVAPPPGNPRFELLDGLRALAALAVVAFHCAVQTTQFRGWSGGYLHQLGSGVTVFFLLSGFLLYRPFVAARFSGRNQIRVRDFARRRLLRIVPAYWLALTVLAIWPGLPGSPLGSDWWRYYGFMQDFSNPTVFNGLGVAWSLGTEVSFYLILPFYALALGFLTRGRTRRTKVTADLGVLACLAAVSFILSRLLSFRYPNFGYTLPGTFDWFAIGMGVAVLSVASQYSPTPPRLLQLIWRRPSICWGAAAAMVVLGAAYWRSGIFDAYSGGPLHLIWAAMAFFLLLPAAFPHSNRGLPRRILSARVIAWIGVVSYGVYLWHLPLVPQIDRGASQLLGTQFTGPLLTIALFLVVTVAAILCAATSYYLVERPILRFKSGFGSRRAQADGASLLASLRSYTRRQRALSPERL